MISTTASGSRRAACSAATATAAAESRPCGSSRMSAARPTCPHCSATMKRASAEAMTVGRANTAGSATRSRLAWNVEARRIHQLGELLGHALARGRPQPRPRPPAQDHRVDEGSRSGHGGVSRGGSAGRLGRATGRGPARIGAPAATVSGFGLNVAPGAEQPARLIRAWIGLALSRRDGYVWSRHEFLRPDPLASDDSGARPRAGSPRSSASSAVPRRKSSPPTGGRPSPRRSGRSSPGSGPTAVPCPTRRRSAPPPPNGSPPSGAPPCGRSSISPARCCTPISAAPCCPARPPRRWPP